MRGTRTSALVVIASVALAATACRSSTSPPANPNAGQPGSATTASTTSTTSPSSAIAPIAMPTGAGTFGTKPPPVTVPTGRPPTVLESADLITGTGPAAKAGDTVTVQYVGVDYSTDRQFHRP